MASVTSDHLYTVPLTIALIGEIEKACKTGMDAFRNDPMKRYLRDTPVSWDSDYITRVVNMSDRIPRVVHYTDGAWNKRIVLSLFERFPRKEHSQSIRKVSLSSGCLLWKALPKWLELNLFNSEPAIESEHPSLFRKIMTRFWRYFSRSLTGVLTKEQLKVTLNLYKDMHEKYYILILDSATRKMKIR